MSVVIQKNIPIHPSELGNLYSSILTKIEKLTMECNSEHGFYLGIENIQIDSRNIKIIHENGYCSVPCKIQVSTFKPEEGDVVRAVMEKHYAGIGLMCSFHRLKILIPSAFLAKSVPIEIGKETVVEIVSLKFEKNTFQSIGRQIE